MTNIPMKYITDKDGNKVLPITNTKAVRDDSGNNIETLLGNEASLRQNADSGLSTRINNEITRAQSAESGLRNLINSETSRASNAEINLDNKLRLLNGNTVVVVTDHTLVSSPDSQTIYRQYGIDSYTDWMYQNSTWQAIATYSYPGIDDEPTVRSNNLIKSGGVYLKTKVIDNVIGDNIIDFNSQTIVPKVVDSYEVIDKTTFLGAGASTGHAYNIYIPIESGNDYMLSIINNGFYEVKYKLVDTILPTYDESGTLIDITNSCENYRFSSEGHNYLFIWLWLSRGTGNGRLSGCILVKDNINKIINKCEKILTAEEIGVTTTNSASVNSSIFSNYINNILTDETDKVTIIFSKGDYSFSSTIVVDHKIKIIGKNNSRLVYKGTDAFLHYKWAFNSSIEDISIITDYDPNGGQTLVDAKDGVIAIRLGTYSTAAVRGLYMKNVIIKYFGIGLEIRRAWLNSFYSVYFMNNVDALYLAGISNSNTFYSCSFDDNEGTGILARSNEIWLNSFIGCSIETNKGGLVDVSTTASAYVKLVFTGCYFEYPDTTATYDEGKRRWLKVNGDDIIIDVKGCYISGQSGISEITKGKVYLENECGLIDSSVAMRFKLPSHYRAFKSDINIMQNPIYDGIQANILDYGTYTTNNRVYSKTTDLISWSSSIDVENLFANTSYHFNIGKDNFVLDYANKNIIVDITPILNLGDNSYSEDLLGSTGTLSFFKGGIEKSYIADKFLNGYSSPSFIADGRRIQWVFRLNDNPSVIKDADELVFTLNADSDINYRINNIVIY